VTGGGRVPAVFLDRDGVLNEVVHDDGVVRGPGGVTDLVVLPETRPALDRLRARGFLLIVVTNQPDIARGRTTQRAVDEIHDLLRTTLAVDDVLVCPHDGREGCRCRKPRPGMLEDAASRHAVDLRRSWLIGDRWVDLAAARAAGVAPVLLERPWSWDRTGAGDPPPDLSPLYTAPTLDGCVAHIETATAQSISAPGGTA
jgi:D-glycero-D-manno-heptose 1,7-bisphosphate phosphatase